MLVLALDARREGEKCFKCKECNVTSTAKQGITRHINSKHGKIIETPNRKEAIRNFPGSGNLSDFQIIIPNKIGGSIVAK